MLLYFLCFAVAVQSAPVWHPLPLNAPQVADQYVVLYHSGVTEAEFAHCSHELNRNFFVDRTLDAGFHSTRAQGIHPTKRVSKGHLIRAKSPAEIDSFLASSALCSSIVSHISPNFAISLPKGENTQSEAVSFQAAHTVSHLVQDCSAPWGLDRLDAQNASVPLDGRYSYTRSGSGVTIYVVDSGIRSTHTEFGSRAFASFTAINDSYGAGDCNGHGSHVAGIAAGTNYGVAKGAIVKSVRILDCDGGGTFSGLLSAFQFIETDASGPAVVSLSFGTSQSDLIDNEIHQLFNQGFPIIVSAGNDNTDACNTSPAASSYSFTVGSSTYTDGQASFSNWGSCVDIFAPGVNIRSVDSKSDTASRVMSGTSMSCPFVSGVAALILEDNSNANVYASLTSSALSDIMSGLSSGSPNKLLHSPYSDSAVIGYSRCPIDWSAAAPRSVSAAGLVAVLTVLALLSFF